MVKTGETNSLCKPAAWLKMAHVQSFPPFLFSHDFHPELIWIDCSHRILPPETSPDSNSLQQIPDCCCLIVDSSLLGVFACVCVLDVSVFSILPCVSVAPQRLTSAVTFNCNSDRKQGSGHCLRAPLGLRWLLSRVCTTDFVVPNEHFHISLNVMRSNPQRRHENRNKVSLTQKKK